MESEIRRRSQELRKNMTKEEKTLWYQYLRTYPVQFKRQFSIGQYFVDFYCYRARLVIELDGSQHWEEKAVEYDRRRTKYIQQQGFAVLRFSNTDVNQNLRGVCAQIDRTVKQQLDRMQGEG